MVGGVTTRASSGEQKNDDGRFWPGVQFSCLLTVQETNNVIVVN
jgi:hypothetical protein